MQCPHCQSNNLKKNGTTLADSQRYFCKNCDRAFTPKSKGKGGRPSTGLTSAERQKAYRKRKRQKDKEK